MQMDVNPAGEVYSILRETPHPSCHFSGAEKKNQRDITHPRPSLKVGMQPLLLSLY
jgi:hypothetical protein